MMVMVRPWKLPSRQMISAWSGATPLTLYPHLRAAFRAVSTASAPVFMGRTMSSPHIFVIISQNGPNWSLWNALEVSVSLRAWLMNASTISGWPCPKLSAE
jgi:hypothetical protein